MSGRRIKKRCRPEDYLTSYSPNDKPWDVHKAQADAVSALYALTKYETYPKRLEECSKFLEFNRLVNTDTGEQRLKLQRSFFCRLRHCPTCQWRRSLLWCARFYRALPSVEVAYPGYRWLFLTLTVRNGDLVQLRQTLQAMNKGWQRLIQLQEWPAFGFIRTTEVTRGKDGSAHPHFHALLFVKPSYFGLDYINQSRWVELWKEAMRLDYTPVVDVRAVRNNDVRKAAPEVLKYALKPADLMISPAWLEELTFQLRKLRFIATGGVLKEVFKEEEDNNDLIFLGDQSSDDPLQQLLRFLWDKPIRHYRLSRRSRSQLTKGAS